MLRESHVPYGTSLSEWLTTQCPDIPHPKDLCDTEQARLIHDYFSSEPSLLAPFFDVFTATACAGSTGAINLCIVDRVGEFTEAGEASQQRITAATTRGTGPLLVVAPAHSTGLLAAAHRHAKVMGGYMHWGEVRGRYGLPPAWDRWPHDQEDVSGSFATRWSLLRTPGLVDATGILLATTAQDGGTPRAQVLLRGPDRRRTNRQGRESTEVCYFPIFDTCRPVCLILDVETREFGLYGLRAQRGRDVPARLYDALEQPLFRTRLARERVTGEAQEARLLGHECQWCFASLPGSIYLMHVCETHATDDVMRALRLRLQQLVGAENGDARLYIFGDNGALSTNMAAASLDAERGLAVLAKPPGSGMGAKEDPTFDNELFGAGCEQERRTIPWAEDMRTLLASVDECPTMHKPSLTGLASNSAPSDDPDTMAIQQSILWDWVGRAGTLVSSTDQATELLRAALPTHSECTALLTLPMSLQTGFLKVNIGQFNIEIADFADRAMRLRCCSEKEAWRICQTPLLTAAASLGELFEPLQHLPEAAAFDLHWYELARPSVWFWLLLEETSRQLQRTVSDSTELPAARDGSFLLMALKGSTAKTRTPPIHYCSALLPMQVLFYAVRQLLDRPNDFPHLKITEVFWEHVENNVMEGPGYALGVRIAASFETADICPLQWEVAKRIRRSFEQGVVALHHPSVMPSIFSHPATYKGRFRIFLPISQEALGLRPSKPALQPANLLASALERVRQWSQLTGFDLRAAAGA